MLPWGLFSKKSQDGSSHDLANSHHLLTSNPKPSLLASSIDADQSNIFTLQTPEPPTQKKPLLAADTLYDTTMYSNRALEATYPFSQRVEYDHTNPITVPSEIASKSVISAYPTLYPLAYHANILVEDDHAARKLYSEVHSQFNRQLSPFYLLYRSTDNIPRVITKEQIPNLMDASKSDEPFYQPIPLVSLPIPTVMNIPQNTYSAPNLLSSFATSALIYRVMQPMVTCQPVFFRDLNSNLIDLKNIPPRLYSVMGQTRTQSMLIPPSAIGNIMTWMPYFELRSYFLSRLAVPKGQSSAGADLNSVYALQTHIFSKTSDNVYGLNMALSLKAPDQFSSPIDRTLASFKASLLVSTLVFPFILSQYYTKVYECATTAVGLFPETLNGRNVGKNVVVATRTGVSEKALPTYGLVNKTLYETFFYDHVRPHVYFINEEKAYKIRYPGIKTFFRDLFKPSEFLTQKYEEFMSRDYARENPSSGVSSPRSAESPAEKSTPKTTSTPKASTTATSSPSTPNEKPAQTTATTTASKPATTTATTPKPSAAAATTTTTATTTPKPPAPTATTTTTASTTKPTTTTPPPNTTTAPPKAIPPRPKPTSPLYLPTVQSRLRFFGRGFLGVQLMWIHFHLALFSYEYIKKTEWATTGRSSYLTRSNPSASSSSTDVEMMRALKSIPNNLTREYSAEYMQEKHQKRLAEIEEKLKKTPWYKRLFKSYSPYPDNHPHAPKPRGSNANDTTNAVPGNEDKEEKTSTVKDDKDTGITTPSEPAQASGAIDNNTSPSTTSTNEKTPQPLTPDEIENMTERQKKKYRNRLLNDLPSMADVNSSLKSDEEDKQKKKNKPSFIRKYWNTFVEKDDANPSTPTFTEKTLFSVGCAVIVSIFTGNIMYPMINSFDHGLIRKLLGPEKRLSRWVGVSLFNTRFTILHSILLLKIAYDDISNHRAVTNFTRNLVTIKSTYYKESSNITPPINLDDAPKNVTTSLSSIRASVANDPSFVPLHQPHQIPSAFTKSMIRLEHERNEERDHNEYARKMFRRLVKQNNAISQQPSDDTDELSILNMDSSQIQEKSNKTTLSPHKLFYPRRTDRSAEYERQTVIYQQPQSVGVDELRNRIVSRGLYILPIQSNYKPSPFTGVSTFFDFINKPKLLEKYNASWDFESSPEYYLNRPVDDIDVPVEPLRILDEDKKKLVIGFDLTKASK